MHVAAATNELSCLARQTTMTDDIRDRNLPCNAAAYQLVTSDNQPSRLAA